MHKPRENIWTQERVDYLKQHYSEDGCVAIGIVLGLPFVTVRNKANRLHLKISKETAHRLIYDVSKQRMTDNNPMHNQSSLNQMLQTWEDNPEKKSQRSQKFLEGKLEFQKTKPSKLEIKLRNILDGMGVEYEPSFLIKPKFIVDIRIDDLIIQADGEYWHGHPRFEPLTERQKAQQKRDHAQDIYLHKCGYTVVRVWERDVTKEKIENILIVHGTKSPFRM